MVGRTLSNHKILSKLGAGGMGEVYLAEDTELKRRVALKVLPEHLADDPERLARFRREAEAVAALNHPNIVTIHSVAEAEGIRFLTMELVEGRELGERIPRGGLPIERFFHLALQLADALAAAHEGGIAHRDLKPGNVMLTEEDRVKVLDFGLAKRMAGALGGEDEETLAATALRTAEGQVVGTVAYMSPEQAQGLEVDARSDIFSLGIVLYEMATGRRPFAGASAVSVLSAILKDEPAAPTEIRASLPRGLDRILRRCLEKRPADRFQTARDVLNELRYLRNEVRSGTAASGPAAGAPTTPRIGRGAIASGGIGLALLAAGLFWWAGREPTPEIGGAVAPIRSVVALPSEVLGGSEEDAYLAAAVPSTLSTVLAGIEGVETKLPPKPSDVDRLEGDLDRLQEVYGVSAFVTSTVTVDSGSLALDVRLVEARGQPHRVRWSQQFAGARDSYLELVRRAGDGLRQAIRPEAVAPDGAAGLAATSEAELALERGRYLSNRFNNQYDPRDYERARASFERALELEPGLAQAAAEIATLEGFRFLTRFEPAALETQEEWAGRALELDPRSGEAWANRFFLHMVRSRVPGLGGGGEPQGLLELALRAAALGAREPLGHESVGLALTVGGGFSHELALPAFAAAARLDPFYISPSLNTVNSLLLLGRPEEALPIVRRARRAAPDSLAALTQELAVLVALGRSEEVADQQERVETLIAEGQMPLIESVFWSFLWRVAEARGRGDPLDLQAVVEESRDQITQLPAPISWLVARFGLREEALGLLESEAERGLLTYDALLLSPDFEGLRDSPRFRDVVEQARRRFETMLRVFDDARAREEMPGYLERPLADLLERLDRPITGRTAA